MTRSAHRPEIHVGTSGWQYAHWRGAFYPPRLPMRQWLGYLAGRLSCVEINSSFYHLPQPQSAVQWREQTPPGFVFAVKAWRQITHRKKLIDCAEPLAVFLERIEPLGEKLGPVLFQLPPRWGCNTRRLAEFLALLPETQRFAFEFRDPSWLNEAVYQLLRARGCALCLYELAGFESAPVITADFVYLRLHGPGGAYAGSYSKQALRRWARQARAWRAEGKEVFVFFDNDQGAYAAHNALTLQGYLSAAD